MKEKVEFGNFISTKRKENNLTQKELAEKLFVSESAVSKWERGLSYPDISLVTEICSVLNISEHELINASEDFHQREIERQSEKYLNLIRKYIVFFNTVYILTVATCFICELAITHKIAWSFIVLTAILLAYSLTVLPVLVKHHKGLITVAASFITLNLLLLTCSIYTQTDWFIMTFVSILFSYVLVFVPVFLRNISTAQSPAINLISRHKAAFCMLIDSVLLFLLVFTGVIYTNESSLADGLKIGMLSTIAGLIFPWFYLIIIRYININGLYKTSLCLVFTGIYNLFINSTLNAIIYNSKWTMPKINMSIWNDTYLNGNIGLITFFAFLFIAVIFLIGGIYMDLSRKRH